MDKSMGTAGFMQNLIKNTKGRPAVPAGRREPSVLAEKAAPAGHIPPAAMERILQAAKGRTPLAAKPAEHPSPTGHIPPTAEDRSTALLSAASFLPGLSSSSGSPALQKEGNLLDAPLDFVTALIEEGLRKQREAAPKCGILGRGALEPPPGTGVSEFASVFHEDGTDAFLSAESFQLGNVRKNGKERIRVAAYIRVSTDDTDQENSYGTQEKYFSRQLEQNEGWTNAGIYSDYGISGTDAGKRTGYQRLLRHCGQGKIDRVVCKSISRFARNTSDFLVAMKTLQENGVTILFEKEGLDTADPTSAFILTTLAAIAQEESRSISSNIRWGYEKRYPKGDSRNHLLYGYRYVEGDDAWEVTLSGYRRKRIEVEETEADAVRRIFDMAEEGMGYTEIARKLNREGVPAPKKRIMNGPVRQSSDTDVGWTGQHIGRMLRCERYCGDAMLQKTYTQDYLTHKTIRNNGEKPQYYVKDHHDAIISREQFDRVQGIVRSRERNTHYTRTDKAFSHRLFCPHCGRFYHNRNGNVYPVWVCPTSTVHNGKARCPSERIYEEQIIRMFRRAFIERFKLTEAPVIDDVRVADIMSGCYGMDGDIVTAFSGEAENFVSRMSARLRDVQTHDFVEKDRGFLKRRAGAMEEDMADTEKRIRRITADLDNISVRRDVLGEQAAPEEEVRLLKDQLGQEQARLEKVQEEKKGLEEKIAYMEDYWDQLERSYDEREKALEWMEGLPEGKEGTAEFLNGLSGTYAKAFALRITVHDPLHYTIRWFDDTTTEVEMYSNVEDHRLLLGPEERRWRELHGYGKG